MWARDLGIGVASALNKVPPNVQQQLSVSRAAVPPRPRSPRPRTARVRAGAGRRAADRANAKLVFVSHASEDKKLAGALVELLRSALNMPADKVLCTSVDGYRLPAGRDADEALRQAVLAARTLVGIISPASERSTYVQAEIGGRWVTRKHMIPVTAGGVSPGQVRGPAGRLNALDLSSRPNVQQLISDLGTELRIEPERPEVFAAHVERVVQASKAARTRSKRRRGAR